MADSQAQERAAKSRIITHMNNDHHDSVVRYLEHYSKVSSSAAYAGKMTDIDLNSMTLTCNGKAHRIQFQPPLKSYTEARERVVELDKECRKALGQSEVTVRKYLPPTGLYSISLAIIMAAFIGYSQRWWFAQNGPVEQILGARFAQFSWRIQPWIFYGMILAHGAETLMFLPKLRRHSVNSQSALYWVWVASTFIEGQFAFIRFDKFVKAQQEKQKH